MKRRNYRIIRMCSKLQILFFQRLTVRKNTTVRRNKDVVFQSHFSEYERRFEMIE